MWPGFNLYYDTALDCYRSFCNLGHCFGVKCLVVENLVFALHCGASCGCNGLMILDFKILIYTLLVCKKNLFIVLLGPITLLLSIRCPDQSQILLNCQKWSAVLHFICWCIACKKVVHNCVSAVYHFSAVLISIGLHSLHLFTWYMLKHPFCYGVGRYKRCYIL